MAADEVGRCPICVREAQCARVEDGYWANCALCGEFKITRTLLRTALADRESQEVKDLLPYLSAHTRQANTQGEVVGLNTDNWKDYALLHKDTPVTAKLTKVLELTAARSKPAGTPVLFEKTDPSLVDATDPSELAYLLDQLDGMGYLQFAKESVDVDGPVYKVTARGWERLERTSFAGKPGKCFVTISFDDSLDEAYERGIKLAVEDDCKMEAVNLKHVLHNEDICDKIIAEIRASQFLVADVTLGSQNVYFEAGFAIGLGRPVIWTCQEDHFKEVHFDTRQYSHIVRTAPEDLREKLRDKIRATILK
jgi:nucleoside 2-deoxyribosyltransferase